MTRVWLGRGANHRNEVDPQDVITEIGLKYRPGESTPASPTAWKVGGVRLDARSVFTASHWTSRGELGALGQREPRTTIEGLEHPRGVSRTDDGFALVAEPDRARLTMIDSTGAVRARVHLPGLSPWFAAQWGDRWLVTDAVRNAIFLVSHDGRKIDRLPVPFELRSPRSAVPVNESEYVLCDREAQMVAVLTRSGEVTWSYGNAGYPDSADGFLTSPEHAIPVESGVVIADTRNHRVLSIGWSGEQLWSVGGVGMVGSAPGRLWHPLSVSVWNSRILITDSGNDRLVEVGAQGELLGVYGAAVVESGLLHLPRSLQSDSDGFSVADSYNNRVVTFSRSGSGLKSTTSALGRKLFWPRHTAELDGTRVISDSRNGRILVAWGADEWVELTLRGNGKEVRLVDPHAVRKTFGGLWMVTDTGLDAVLLFEPRTGELLQVWHGGAVDEDFGGVPTTVLPLVDVHDAAIDPVRGVWFANTGRDEIVHLPYDAKRLSIVEPRYPSGLAYDFSAPRSVELSGQEMLVTDSGNHRVVVMDRSGRILGQYGRRRGHALDCLSDPRFSTYSNGSVAIADYLNDRVLLIPRSAMRSADGVESDQNRISRIPGSMPGPVSGRSEHNSPGAIDASVRSPTK